jgi:hypothetical protein
LGNTTKEDWICSTCRIQKNNTKFLAGKPVGKRRLEHPDGDVKKKTKMDLEKI